MVSSTSIAASETDDASIWSKRTVMADMPHIQQLVSSTEINTYPQTALQIGRVIETSIISLTLMKGEKIVGFGAFDNPNNLEKVVEENKLDLKNFSSRTTLSFTVLILSRREDENTLVRALFKSLFDSVPTFYHIMVPWADKRLEGLGRHISPKLTLLHRDEFLPELYVRDAKVEDNDDVGEVYASESEQLKKFYGKFFFSELVEASDSRNKVLVADVNDTAVGCISVSSDIGFDLLRRTHHIGHFDGLNPHNAISIQIYTIKTENQSRGVDLVRGALKSFPSANWVIITLPRQIPYFKLLDLFTRVTPKNANLEHEVFVLHRGVLTNSVEVRPATSEDVRNLTQIDFEIGAAVENALEEGCDEDGNEMKAMSILLGSTIIGGIVLKEENEIRKLRSYFDIEQFIHFKEQKIKEHFRITNCSIAPGYQALTRFVLSDTLRQLDGVTLYQRITDNSDPKSATVKELINITRRPKIHYNPETLGINMPSEWCFGDHNFGLLLFSKKHTYEQRIQLSHAIVVVGASDVGVSAVSKLAFIPHLTLNNLTWVSDFFDDDINDSENVQPRLVNSYKDPDPALCVSVNKCRAKMAGINVNQKRLILSNGQWLPYDILLICTGKQVKGVFNHNEQGLDGRQLSRLIKILNERKEATIFINGTSIEALAIIERLITSGVEPDRIILGLHDPMDSLFDVSGKEDLLTHKLLKETDIAIGPDMLKMLKEIGVDVITGVTKTEVVKLENGADCYGQIDFIKVNDTHEYECDIFLDLSARQVSKDIFQVLTDACLVYDGALVVQPDFSTSNSSVLSAGTMTKYSRRLHADQWTHSMYNSDDVGRGVAEEIIQRIQNTNVKIELSVPVFTSPIIQSCLLPGGKHYLSIKSPPRDTLSDGNKAKMARWLYSMKDNVISKVHINPFGMIDEMMYVSSSKLPIDNLIRVFGIHETYLNKLTSRYDEDLIPCLMQHISTPSMSAVNHDRFKTLVEEYDELVPLTIDDINPHTYQKLDETYGAQIEDKLLGFLEHNRPLLSMYADPTYKKT